MDLSYSPSDIEFREATRRWLEANVPRPEPTTLDARRAWHRRLYDAGYVGMGWPVQYGGRGATPLQQAIVADEMARAGAPSPINPLGLAIVGPTIIVHGTEAQKRRYLRPILTAEELWCQLYSEPGAGSDLASLRTRAEDGPWREAIPETARCVAGEWKFELPRSGPEPLLKALIDGGAGIETLSIERPGLHDAFIAIAGEAAAREMGHVPSAEEAA